MQYFFPIYEIKIQAKLRIMCHKHVVNTETVNTEQKLLWNHREYVQSLQNKQKKYKMKVIY